LHALEGLARPGCPFGNLGQVRLPDFVFRHCCSRHSIAQDSRWRASTSFAIPSSASMPARRSQQTPRRVRKKQRKVAGREERTVASAQILPGAGAHGGT
jgi:hypothetical protein